MPRPVSRPAALVAALTLVLAACGGGSAGHEGHDEAASVPEPVPGAQEVTVEAVDVDFRPDRLELEAGEPLNVTVTNSGKALHDFTLSAADVHVNVEPGDTVATSLTLDDPGTYEALCTVPGHAEAGMTVEVTVTE